MTNSVSDSLGVSTAIKKRKKTPSSGRQAKPLPQVGAAQDPRSLTPLVLRFLGALEVRGYSAHTRRTYRYQLGWFLGWCQERALERPNAITLPVLENYLRYLFMHRRSDGGVLGGNSLRRQLDAIKAFFRYLTRQHLILSNPASELELPKHVRPLPIDTLSAAQAEAVLNEPDVTTPKGVRDRAILEVLYSTGLRRSELSCLAVDDIDFDHAVVKVRAGKGNQDRVVPIGERALAWVQKYREQARPHYVQHAEERSLFLNYKGERLEETYLSRTVHRYLQKAQVLNRGACHVFRHTVATLMLENGADIRYIQAMLGHKKLETTQVYTQVSIAKLKQVHAATHPAQRGGNKPHTSPEPLDDEASIL